MLEFARERWLWLFALVGVFYVAWWFARRYRKRRVTYGRVWERVAKRVLPPGWKRVLRTVLTLLISGMLLSSVVLYAAGLQRPKGDRPAPLIVAIVLDNSPSMRATHDGKTRAQLAQDRAQQIVDTLGEHDRALLAWFNGGQPLLGRWLTHGDSVGDPPATDFAKQDLAALRKQLAALQPPPGLPAEPAPVKLAFWLGDAPPKLEAAPTVPRLDSLSKLYDVGVPAYVETFGAADRNDAVVRAKYTPPGPADPNGGVIKADSLSGDDLEFSAIGLKPGLVSSRGKRFELPVSEDELDVSAYVIAPDALPQDDRAAMKLHPRRLASVTLCYPAEDGEANPFLVKSLQGFLPGREIQTHAVQPGDSVKADLLVCDRALPGHWQARFLLCFGVIPPAWGKTGAPVDARPNLQLRVPPPDDLGFEVPELTLLNGSDAVPLQDSDGLAPLAKLFSGETLIGVKRGDPELLYVGFLPHKSTLLQDTAGLLLLLRWLMAIQGSGRVVFPPFVPLEAETDFRLDQPGELQIQLADGNPWLPCIGPRAFRVVTGPDGRGKLGPFVIPGEYRVLRGGQEVARFAAVWDDPGEQALPFQPAAQADLASLFRRSVRPDWRDYLPGLLLWIALGALLVEWLLWLAGVTE